MIQSLYVVRANAFAEGGALAGYEECHIVNDEREIAARLRDQFHRATDQEILDGYIAAGIFVRVENNAVTWWREIEAQFRPAAGDYPPANADHAVDIAIASCRDDHAHVPNHVTNVMTRAQVAHHQALAEAFEPAGYFGFRPIGVDDGSLRLNLDE